MSQKQHDGSEMPEAPSAVNSHRSHGFAAETPAQPGDIARNASRGKDVRDVPIHGGMTNKQMGGMHTGGMGHPVESGGQVGVNPLAKPAVGDYKTGRSAPANPGTPHDGSGCGHSADIGRQMLNEAVKSGGKC
jgi:hypothetical protein